MRIALDTQSTLGRPTGIGRYTAMLADAIRQTAPEHQVVDLNLGRDEVMRTDRRLRWQQIGLPWRARRAGADVLHVTGFDGPLWRPVPTVLTVHDLIGVLFPENLPPIARRYWSRWLPFTARFADEIIADSDCTRRDVVRLLGIPDERITVVPLGVDPLFKPQSPTLIEEIKARHSLKAPYVLFVGTLEPRKGVDTLVEAFSVVARESTATLALVGKRGWYWERLARRVATSEVGDRIRLLDYVPDADLPALYAGAAVFALPSRYEGFGLPILEAMRCGTPVVCSNISSLPEVGGDAALYIAPNDPADLASALRRVLADAALAESLRTRGQERARSFTWERTAVATLAVYERAARRSETRR